MNKILALKYNNTQLKISKWQSDVLQKVHLHHSPCILGFMCSYYRQQVIVHQEVTYCWVTEKKKQQQKMGSSNSSKGACSLRIR